MKTTQEECCPTCRRPFKPARRLCCRCGKQITRGHKWQFLESKGKTTVAHKNCDDPGSYR